MAYSVFLAARASSRPGSLSEPGSPRAFVQEVIEHVRRWPEHEHFAVHLEALLPCLKLKPAKVGWSLSCLPPDQRLAATLKVHLIKTLYRKASNQPLTNVHRRAPKGPLDSAIRWHSRPENG